MIVDINTDMKIIEKIEGVMEIPDFYAWVFYLPKETLGRISVIKRESYDSQDCIGYAFGMDSKSSRSMKRCGFGCLINLMPEIDLPQQGDIAIYLKHKTDRDVVVHAGIYQEDKKILSKW